MFEGYPPAALAPARMPARMYMHALAAASPQDPGPTHSPPPYRPSNPASVLIPWYPGPPVDPLAALRPATPTNGIAGLWMPGDNGARAAGEQVQPGAHRESPRGEITGNENRSVVSKMAIQTVFVGSLAKSGLDLTRVAVKAPEAVRAGIKLPWVFNLVKVAPDTRVIDPRMPRIATAASGWRSFTRFDESTYRTSAVIGAGLATIQLASAVPNLIEAWQEDGVDGLINSRSGRSGVLQAAGGMLGLGTLGYAAWGAHQAGSRGFVDTIVKASASPRLASLFIVNVGLIAGGLVLLNEWGFFDLLNKDDDRGVGASLSDAAHNIPFV